MTERTNRPTLDSVQHLPIGEVIALPSEHLALLQEEARSTLDLTRQAMAWAKARPEAFSEKTGKPDTRGAYGLMAREVIGLLKHLQHAPGKTTIMVGILEKVTDEFGKVTWQPQMEGGKAGRELPGIVDQVTRMAPGSIGSHRASHLRPVEEQTFSRQRTFVPGISPSASSFR